MYRLAKSVLSLTRDSAGSPLYVAAAHINPTLGESWKYDSTTGFAQGSESILVPVCRFMNERQQSDQNRMSSSVQQAASQAIE